MLRNHSAMQISLTRETVRRRTFREWSSPDVPRFVEVDQYRLSGKIYKRIRIILRSNGCSKPTCTMCPLPNEALNPKRVSITASDYVQQLQAALQTHQDCEMVCIYNDGSFFSLRELPKEARQAIYHIIASYGCRYLMVESLPEYITKACITDARDVLKDVNVVVGIGLQSASHDVRKLCINSPVTLQAFRKAHQLMQEHGFKTKAYVMLKPPFLSEAEAIKDASATVVWLRNQNVEDITLCPTRVAAGTIVYDLFNRGLYSPPKLISIVECLKRNQQKKIHTRVSVFNLDSSDFQAQTPSGCARCESHLLAELRRYNSDPDSVSLEKLSCQTCSLSAHDNDPHLFLGLPLPTRVQKYFDLLA